MKTWIAAAALLCAGEAMAIQTFDFAINGEAHNTGCQTTCSATQGTFSGSVQVKLADGGDGVYSGNSLRSIDLWAKVSGVIPSLFRNSYHFGTDGNTPTSNLFPTVTRADGQISFIYAALPTYGNANALIRSPYVQILDFTGDSANVVANGVLTPVPEPETYALMLTGLAFAGFAARRRRRV